MRSAARATLHLAAWTTGATLLAIALLDYLASEFALAELAFYEDRLHPQPVPDIHIMDPWTFDYWLDMSRESPHADLLLACAVFGLLSGLIACVTRRRALLLVAATCAATLLGLAVSAASTLRAGKLADLFLAYAPGTRLRWLWPGYKHHVEPWYTYATESTALIVLALLLPVLTVAGIRINVPRWRTIVLPGVLATITAGALAYLWIHFANTHAVLRSDEFTGWVEHVQLTRHALVCAALILFAALLGTRPRPVPAAVTLALGLAALVATTPHRRTIDTLYPIRDPGSATLLYSWLPAPWTFEPPPAQKCRKDQPGGPQAAIGLDAGELVLDLDGVRLPLVGEATVRALDTITDPHDRSPHLSLLVDRRVPAAALAPFLDQLARTDIAGITVIGAVIQDLPSVEGRVITWTLCGFGELREPGALPRTTGMTWDELVRDPALVDFDPPITAR